MIDNKIFDRYIQQFVKQTIPISVEDCFFVGNIAILYCFSSSNSISNCVVHVIGFFKIQITAENLGEEETTVSGGQMYLLDDEDKKHEPVYGGFSDQDLLYHHLEPKKPIT